MGSSVWGGGTAAPPFLGLVPEPRQGGAPCGRGAAGRKRKRRACPASPHGHPGTVRVRPRARPGTVRVHGRGHLEPGFAPPRPPGSPHSTKCAPRAKAQPAPVPSSPRSLRLPGEEGGAAGREQRLRWPPRWRRKLLPPLYLRLPSGRCRGRMPPSCRSSLGPQRLPGGSAGGRSGPPAPPGPATGLRTQRRGGKRAGHSLGPSDFPLVGT